MNDRTAASALPNLSKVLLRQPIWTVLVLSFMLMSLVACGSGMEGDPIISTSSTPTGATASLVWDPVPDPSVIAYNVHYGKQSAGQPGSCSYSNSQTVNSPAATITGLEPNTRYFFAVSAYNGVSGPCSNEVSTVTPPSQT